MTKQDAIMRLAKMSIMQVDRQNTEALGIAIDALNQESKEDCISRADTLEILDAMANIDRDNAKVYSKIYSQIKDTPSVAPKCGEWEKVPYKKQGHDEIVIDGEAWRRTNCGSAKKKNEPQMNQYIRREEILNHEVCKGIECQDCPFAEGPLCRLRRYILHAAPSADVAEVRHGKWIVYPLMDEGRVELECPICGDTFIRAVDYKPHFCENCGAKMKGQRNDSN